MFSRLLLVLLLAVVVRAHADDRFGVEFRYVNVMPGQTLGQIVNRIYPPDAGPRETIIQEIVRLNPHAFVRQDPNRMIAGVKLVLPRPVDLANANRREVGWVTHSAGQPAAVDLLGRDRTLQAGDRIFTGDLLQTGETARLHLYMADGAHLYLRPCSEFRIIDYLYVPGEAGRSRLQLLRGGLATETGRIGREFGQNYALATPMATIGVRGTRYAVQFCADRQCDPCAQGDDSSRYDELHVGVTAGAVTVALPREKLEVGSDQYLLAASDDRPPIWSSRDPNELMQAIRAEPEPAPVVETTEEETGGGWLGWILGLVLLALAL